MYHIKMLKGAKPVKCKFCNERFANDSLRDFHANKIHGMMDKYDIEDCDKIFKTPHRLFSHRNGTKIQGNKNKPS